MSSGDRAPVSSVKAYYDNLKFLYYNTRSIVFKIDDLKANCLLYKPDIVCIVETWLGNDVLDSEIYIPDYEFTRLDRDRHGGGVIIYVAGHLQFKVISSGPHSLEFLAISVSSPFGQFVVSVLYRPPSSPVSFFDNLSLVLEDLCTPLYSHFFIFGDFNVDVSVPDYLCNYLYNVANLHALAIIPTGHTRVTSSCATTIDLMLTTSPELVKNCQTIPPIGTSDHNGIISVVSLLTHTVAPQPSRKIWRYSHANFSLANELLSNINPSHILVDGDPSTSWNNWCNAFLDVMHKSIPNASLPSRRNLPWLSKRIIQLMRKRNTLFRRSKVCPSLIPKYKKVRNAITNALRASKNNFFATLKPSRKDFWKAINSLNGSVSSIPTLINSDGSPVSSPASKATLLNLRFSQNFNTSTPPLTTADILPIPPYPCPENILCSEEKTYHLICSLNNNKAMGLDKISARMLKETVSSITPMITAIFNMSLSTGTCPDSWKSSLIVPIPKSGDSSNPGNYRPISLLPIVSKLLEKHICDLLCKTPRHF